MKYSLRTLFLVTTTLCISFVVYVACTKNLTKSDSGVTSAAANRSLWIHLRLPHDANDVTFCVDQYGCEAEFAVSEISFLRWCRNKDFKYASIKTPKPYFPSIMLPSDKHLVGRGYQFSIPDGRGVFDIKRGRAAFWASTFP